MSTRLWRSTPLRLTRSGSPRQVTRADRVLAIVDESGERIDAARTARVHPLRTLFDTDTGRVVVRVDELAFRDDTTLPADEREPELRVGDPVSLADER